MDGLNGMTAREIKAALILHGIKLKDIGARAGVSGEAVSLVISGKGRRYKGYRVRTIIAEALGVPVEDIWPGEPAPDTSQSLRALGT